MLIGHIQGNQTIVSSPKVSENKAGFVGRYLETTFTLKNGILSLTGKFSLEQVKKAYHAYAYEYGKKADEEFGSNTYY